MNKFKKHLCLLWGFFILVTVIAATSCDYSDDEKVVLTTEGLLKGFAGEGDTWVWKGVPYAAPPVNELRWRPPQDPAPWTGIRDADEWGDQAAQPAAYAAYGNGGVSEDCLYLNITAPKNVDHKKCHKGLPVMVFFHGGAFGILTGNSDAYNNANSLPQKGVVLITVNHRLGPFGYLAHPDLTAESGYGGSGNYGQMDLIKALKWIKRNIKVFGGDPHSITTFGQSGGGGKAISLMASPLAKRLFNRVICESGMADYNNPVLDAADLASAEAKGTDLVNRLIAYGVVSASPSLAELRAVPWETISNIDLATYGEYAWLRYGPNIDNYYLTADMQTVIQEGLPSDVPFMAGANTSDLIAGADLKDGVTAQMIDRKQYNSAPQYVYRWNHVPVGWLMRGAGAYHGLELVYVFNYPMSFISHYVMGLPGLTDADIGATPEAGTDVYYFQVLASTGFYDPAYFTQYQLVPLESEQALVDNVMTIWATFAATGNPSTDGVVQWDEFNLTSYDFLEIGQGGTFTMVTSTDEAEWLNQY